MQKLIVGSLILFTTLLSPLSSHAGLSQSMCFALFSNENSASDSLIALIRKHEALSETDVFVYERNLLTPEIGLNTIMASVNVIKAIYRYLNVELKLSNENVAKEIFNTITRQYKKSALESSDFEQIALALEALTRDEAQFQLSTRVTKKADITEDHLTASNRGLNMVHVTTPKGEHTLILLRVDTENRTLMFVDSATMTKFWATSYEVIIDRQFKQQIKVHMGPTAQEVGLIDSFLRIRADF